MHKTFYSCILFFWVIAAHAQPPIHQYSIGNGEPILLINGGPGWSSHHMQPVAERLANMGYKVIRFDQRGTGQSAVQLDSSTIKFSLMIEDIERIRKERGISSMIIYGHSFGGMLAMAYASKYPARVKQLILSAPGGCDLSFLDYYQTNLNYTLSKKEREAIGQWSDPKVVKSRPKSASYHIIQNTISSFVFHKNLTDKIMGEIDKNTWKMPTSNLVWQDLAKMHYDLKPVLHKIIAPTLIIQGRQDALGLQNPMTINQLIPNSRLVVLEKSAHLMWIDQPEKYYQTIGHFLKSSLAFSPIDSDSLFAKMKGNKKLTASIHTKNGFTEMKGRSSFRTNFNSLVESFSLPLPHRTVMGKAYIRYAKHYNRFELVQADNAAGSLIMLNGFWNPKTHKLIFRPIKNYSQWGSTGTLKLKWEYTFSEDGSFKKTMLIPGKDGRWKVASEYLYQPQS